MTDYAMTGKKGTGKSKNTVRLARDRYLRRGRMVATNLDIDLKAMFGSRSRYTYIRVPDKPTAFDLEACGHGNHGSKDEDTAGMMALDEMGTWLNTRTFGDKDRAATLDYLAHARKHGWDCYYIMQNVVQVDKQLRESFIEQTVRHVRFDKIRWPLVGGILGSLFGERAAYMPRFHAATARLGCNPQELVCDRATFVGKDLEACYDTQQVFRADYPHGTHTVLSPWHVEGRYLPEPPLSGWRAFLAAWRRPRGTRAPRTLPPPVHPVPAPFRRALDLCRQLPAHERVHWARVVNRHIDAYLDRQLHQQASLQAGASAAPAPAQAGAGAARSAA